VIVVLTNRPNQPDDPPFFEFILGMLRPLVDALRSG